MLPTQPIALRFMVALLVATFAAGAALAADATDAAPEVDFAGLVFVATNDDSNEVVAMRRQANGMLDARRIFSTGGSGVGEALGNQGGVVLRPDGRYLYVVNAGSDSITVFAVEKSGLRQVDVQPSGGVLPKSVAIRGSLVYVLNGGVLPPPAEVTAPAGTRATIVGFRQLEDGTLDDLSDSERGLSTDLPDPAQIGFSRDGRFLVVTEKATSAITTYRLDADGRPGSPVTTVSAGTTPFGFVFDRENHLIVAEANENADDGGSVSSYELNDDGTLTPLDPEEPTNQTGTCWVALTRNGGFAFVTNTEDNTVSNLRVEGDGDLALLGIAGDASKPIDAAFTPRSPYLYVLESTGSVAAFRVHRDGSLTALGSFGNLPESSNGLAVH